MPSALDFPTSLAGLLIAFRPCFTGPSFTTFCAMVSGFFTQTNERNVCGMLSAAGLAQRWHHSRAHRFFSNAIWSVDDLGFHLARLIIDTLVGDQAPIHLVVDDTLLRRSGRKVFGASWTHDGSATGPKKIGFGNCFVVVGIVVTVPFCTRPVCLPVCFKLWRKGDSKVTAARRLVCRIRQLHPDRKIHVVGDAAYSSRALRNLPRAVTWTTRLRKNAALHELAPPRTGKRGRPRTKGNRLPSLAGLAKSLYWATRKVTRYGTLATVEIAHRRCLWPTPFGSQIVRVVLVREQGHKGYDVAFVTTDLDATAVQIVERYASRWSIEVAIEEGKQVIGVGEARNRTESAVRRTAPFGFICQSLLWLWYATGLHHDGVVKDRRHSAPWYRTKATPSTFDMLVIARRALIAARFSPRRPSRPTSAEIQTVIRAWEMAAA